MLKKLIVVTTAITLIFAIPGCALFADPPLLPQIPHERPEPQPPEKPAEDAKEPWPAGVEGIPVEDLPEPAAVWFSGHYRTKGAYLYQHPNYVYLMIAAGEKPTGGHKIEVKDINLEDFPRVITVAFVPPAPGAVVTQAITYPSLIISIETDMIADYLVRTVDGEELAVQEKIHLSALELPREGEVVDNPLRVKGKIAAFEAMFVVRIYDDNDRLLKEQIMMAEGGGPMWGNYDGLIEYLEPATAAGRVEIGEFSAKDGSYKLRESVKVRFR